VIADTGVPSPTGVAVGDVRTGWQAEPEKYEALFSAIGEIARQARAIIASGHPDNLGLLMDENHRLLADMGVSSPELDRLVAAAREAGALGAKLSGGGRGGNMIALVQPRDAESIANALLAAGVVNAIITSVGK
jgi:mevalonate kinase